MGEHIAVDKKRPVRVFFDGHVFDCIGRELLNINIRSALILVSTLDPDAPDQMPPHCVFRFLVRATNSNGSNVSTFEPADLCSHQESNLDYRYRKPAFYPLNYESICSSQIRGYIKTQKFPVICEQRVPRAWLQVGGLLRSHLSRLCIPPGSVPR